MSIINTVPVDNSETLYNVTLTSTSSPTCSSIIATVTSSAAEAADWISNILSFHSPRLDSLIVGLDVEWRPSYSRHQNPVALLQLCVLAAAASCSSSSTSSPTLDSGLLASVRNTMDLRVVAVEVYGRREMKQMGPARLADEVVGLEVRKPKRTTMSQWDQEHLRLDQIGCACVDAFLSFEIGRRLIA